MATDTSSSESEAEGEIHLHGSGHGLEGYQFEPEGAYSESSDDGGDEGEVEGDSDPQAQPQESRVGNTAWCTCGHCAHTSLSRAKEQLRRKWSEHRRESFVGTKSFLPIFSNHCLSKSLSRRRGKA